jgi:hypothetical protein
VVSQVHSWMLRGVVINHSFENACTAFPSTLVSMLELSPPLPVLLLLRVRGLSRLNTRAIQMDLGQIGWGGMDWIVLAQDRERWRAVATTVMNRGVQ